jgi:hypothetical protein
MPLRAPNHRVVLAIILLLRPGYEWADLNLLQKDDISASLSAPNLPVHLTCVKAQESTHPSLWHYYIYWSAVSPCSEAVFNSRLLIQSDWLCTRYRQGDKCVEAKMTRKLKHDAKLNTWHMKFLQQWSVMLCCAEWYTATSVSKDHNAFIFGAVASQLVNGFWHTEGMKWPWRWIRYHPSKINNLSPTHTALTNQTPWIFSNEIH